MSVNKDPHFNNDDLTDITMSTKEDKEKFDIIAELEESKRIMREMEGDYPDPQLKREKLIDKGFSGTLTGFIEWIKDMCMNGSVIFDEEIHQGKSWERPYRKLELISGGFSTMEYLMSRVQGSIYFSSYWASTHRGGLTIYHIPVEVLETNPEFTWVEETMESRVYNNPKGNFRYVIDFYDQHVWDIIDDLFELKKKNGNLDFHRVDVPLDNIDSPVKSEMLTALQKALGDKPIVKKETRAEETGRAYLTGIADGIAMAEENARLIRDPEISEDLQKK